MASGRGYLASALAGAIGGYGAGLEQQGKWEEERAKEQRLAEIQKNRDELMNSFAVGMQQSQQAFQSKEREAGQGFQTSERLSTQAHQASLQDAAQAFQLARDRFEAKDREALVRLSKSLEDASRNNDVITVQADDEGKMYGVTRSGGKIDLGIKGSKALTEQMRLLVGAMGNENKADHEQIKDLRESLTGERDQTKRREINEKIGEIASRIEDRNEQLLETLSPGMAKKVSEARKESQGKMYEKKIGAVPNEALTALDYAKNDPEQFKKLYGANPADAIKTFRSKWGIEADWALDWFSTNRKPSSSGIPR